jgi:hypothetical protein
MTQLAIFTTTFSAMKLWRQKLPRAHQRRGSPRVGQQEAVVEQEAVQVLPDHFLSPEPNQIPAPLRQASESTAF